MWTIIRDITERKRAVETLNKSENSLKKAQELGKIGNWELDLKTQKINWSDQVYVLYEREKKLGSPTVEEEAKYYTPEVAEKLHEFARLATETGKEYRYDFTIKLPNGRIAFFNSSINPVLDEKGNVIKLLGTVQDITERKHAEEERIQLLAREHAALAEAEAARKLDKLKSIFIASTSHELRTPLNAIIGFSSMLLDGFSGELNPEQIKQLDIVHSAGKHLLLLISDVIDVSKIEAGKIDLKVSEVELKHVVDEAVSTLGASIKEKGLLVSVEVEKVTLKTDKMRLIQCIYNLIGNAVKYTEKGSIKIIAKTTGNRVDISVTDTGIGIKNEDIPKLFAPFVRLQTPLTEKTSGTGLGLYLVKKLSKDFLGGDVEVESEYGTGSKFTLNIPIELERQG
jgi:PAS domain S-box-containing protein